MLTIYSPTKIEIPINCPLQYYHYIQTKMVMNLLTIDGKFVALHLDFTTKIVNMINITDHLTDHTIKNIIFNCGRFVISTTTGLYYLYIKNGFKFVDITDDVKKTINIDNIKFVINVRESMFNRGWFGILTNCGKVYVCNMYNNKFGRINIMASVDIKNKDIVAVSSRDLGYIYKNGHNKYVIEQCCLNDPREMYVMDKLPTIFISPYIFLHDTKLMVHYYYKKSFVEENVGISHMYGEDYHVKDGLIYRYLLDDGKPIYCCHDDNILIDYCENRRIVIKDRNINYIIDGGASNIVQYHISQSHYHVENLLMYSNNTLDIKWTPNDHHLFGKYIDKLVKLVLMCHKRNKFVPKCVLFMIVQLVL